MASCTCSIVAPLTPNTYWTFQSRSVPTRASTSFTSDRPNRRRRVVSRVREAAERHARPLLQEASLRGALDVQRDGGAEEISVLLERFDLLLFRDGERLAPIAQEECIGLIGD